MKKFNTNSIMWCVVIAIVALSGVYFKFYYPNSQLQLKMTFKYVSALPIEYYYNATEKSCGIWYEGEHAAGVVTGRKNDAVKNCFRDAFKSCDSRRIFLVQDNSAADSRSIIYSMLRVIRKNDAGECIIQNYFEEQNLEVEEGAPPISYINTCTVLNKDFIFSCEPLYIKEIRTK